MQPTRLSPGTTLALMRRPKAPNDGARRRATEWTVEGGKVVFFPCVRGAVRIVGLGPNDEWISEYICREEDFDEALVRRMQRHVTRHAAAREQLKVVK